MKQHTMSRPSTRRYRAPAYPNAADRRYFVEKAVNIVTAILVRNRLRQRHGFPCHDGVITSPRP